MRWRDAAAGLVAAAAGATVYARTSDPPPSSALDVTGRYEDGIYRFEIRGLPERAEVRPSCPCVHVEKRWGDTVVAVVDYAEAKPWVVPGVHVFQDGRVHDFIPFRRSLADAR
jgi:hypothetical protein